MSRQGNARLGEKREKVEQIAALPLIRDNKGRLRVLMVTSRDTGRWVMPKGWLMDGKKPWRAAEIEALEEAGAVGRMASRPIGTYEYDKRLDDGTVLPCQVTVYPMLVERLERRWKERGQRTRRWFSLAKAARSVDEPGLAALLTDLATRPDEAPRISGMRAAS